MGCWSRKSYTLLKKLGSGGVGEIYLVADNYGKPYAMKISRDLVSITKEYANLEKFSGACFAPKAYDLDDCEKDGTVYHFFIMEYIEGYTLRDVISKEKLSVRNKLDIVRIITGVLKDINDLGYVYTDLKYENIMLDRKNRLIRLVDLGSITPIGEGVKEYTPMYDRSNWNSGSRTADLSYQVFTIVILLISMLLGKDINPRKDELANVMCRLKKSSFPEGLYDMVKGCLDGSIADCGSLSDRLGVICRSSCYGTRLTYVLNAVIAFLSLLLAVLIRAVFA